MTGNPWMALAAFGASLVLGYLMTLPARFGPLESANPVNPFALPALFGVFLGGLATVARAAAHKQSDWEWLDYLGKLLAVAAFGFGFIAAVLAFDAPVIALTAVLLGVLVFVILVVLLSRRNVKKGI